MTTIEDSISSFAKITFWFLLARGIVATVFGLLALFQPVSTFKVLLFIFGIFCLLDGVISIVAGFALRGPQWGWIVFNGFIGIILGFIAMRYPESAAVAIFLLIAAWALVSGLLHIFGSFGLKSEGDPGWYWTLISGLISVSLGVFFFAFPKTGLATVVLVLGIYALIYGVVLIFGAFGARKAIKNAFA
ncbi:MAG TPA: HdeD family acid-resistance protein [Aeromicrobium sp.]|nr:HdeD family acid-resistance protein [Aeromicrobium sp.]